MIAALPRYFTVWSLCVVALGPRLGAASIAHACAVVTATVGGYLTYVHPRRITVFDDDGELVDLRGPPLWFVDALFHQLPLWYCCIRRSGPFLTIPGILGALLLLFVYAGDPVTERYGLRSDEFAALAAAQVALLLLLVAAEATR